MAHGVADELTATDEENCVQMVTKQHTSVRKAVGVMGSRRIFAPAFKLKVLDSYRNDIDCRGNQRATARKYGIHRRQIQKWLQCEDNLRSSCVDAAVAGRGHNHNSGTSTIGNSAVSGAPMIEGPREPAAAPAPALNLSRARLHGDEELSLPPPQQGPPLRQHCPASPRYASPHPVVPQNGQISTTLSPIHPGADSQPQHFLANAHGEYLAEAAASHLDPTTLHRYGSRSEDRSSYYLTKSSYEIDSVLKYEDAAVDAKLYHQASSRYNNGLTVERYSRNLTQDNFPGISNGHRDIGSQISPAVAIKNEPASLDAVATVAAAAAPGPTDSREQPTGRPSSRSTLSPLPPRGLSPHHATAAAVAVHSELSRTSPLVRTQSSNDDGGYHGGAKANENSGNAHKDGNAAASLRQAVARPHAYPEPHQQHTHTQQPQHHLTQTHTNALGDGEYADRSQPPASAPAQCLSSMGGSPPLERVLYSGPSSPARSISSMQSSRGPLSSGHSTTSSDSETDALDYSTTTLAPSNDLARRRSFSLRFKLDVLDAFHRDAGVAGNQRATARKFGINRRQVQKWLSQETELRGEIALRGGISRQRLGPLASTDSPIDLRTNSIPADTPDVPALASPQESYSCCYSPDTASPSHRQPYFVSAETSDILLSSSSGRRCTMSCCADNVSCYSQESVRISESNVCSYNRIQTCYASESHSVFACLASHDSTDVSNAKPECSALCYDPEHLEHTPIGSSSPLKRSCTLSCCSYATSPKRLRAHTDEENMAPQDAPLCLVKPKGTTELASQVEPVTSTVPSPPAPPAVPSVPPSVGSTKRDAILFKPYLDNPIAKPTEDQVMSNGSSPHHYNNNNNNNNCQSVCNLNSNNAGAGNRNGEGYAVELSLRVPISWGTPGRGIYTDISQVGSAFMRYPTMPHYT